MTTISGKKIGPIGFGLMGLTWRPTVTPESQAFDTMRAALENGSNFWNSAEFYGQHPTPTTNLQLLNRYFTRYPEDAGKVVLSIKGGVELETGHLTLTADRAGVIRSVENTLRILDGKVFVDIFQTARVARDVPIEETVGALAEFVAAGKIGGIGLCEASAATIRRACSVHPIAAVEVEVSLWSREIFGAGGVAETCAELGIPIVAYSPLGRGFLTGRFKGFEDVPAGDFRKVIDRFQPGNLEKNLEIVHRIDAIARKRGVTKAQLCLAWVRRQGGAEAGKDGKPVIIPIPGATTRARLEENCTLVEFTDEGMEDVDELVATMEVHGGRYNDHLKGGLMV